MDNGNKMLIQFIKEFYRGNGNEERQRIGCPAEGGCHNRVREGAGTVGDCAGRPEGKCLAPGGGQARRVVDFDYPEGDRCGLAPGGGQVRRAMVLARATDDASK